MIGSGFSDPSHFDIDPTQNRKFINNIIIIGFRNYRENYIKTRQYNKETNFHNLRDPKPGLGDYISDLLRNCIYDKYQFSLIFN